MFFGGVRSHVIAFPIPGTVAHFSQKSYIVLIFGIVLLFLFNISLSFRNIFMHTISVIASSGWCVLLGKNKVCDAWFYLDIIVQRCWNAWFAFVWQAWCLSSPGKIGVQLNRTRARIRPKRATRHRPRTRWLLVVGLEFATSLPFCSPWHVPICGVPIDTTSRQPRHLGHCNATLVENLGRASIDGRHTSHATCVATRYRHWIELA